MLPLKIENVSKRYGDHTAVNQINIDLEQGEIFGLLGGNGAGKTTTMRMVLGILKHDEGEIYWKGKTDISKVIPLLGYLPEERGLYPKIKVKDQIKYLAKLKGIPGPEADRRLKEWLEKFEVTDYYDKKVEELSKGNQQKIQFIAAVIHQPEILVLDEAFSGLDPVNVELLKRTVLELKDQGTSILFSTHRMEHVEELCENICILQRSNTVLAGNLKKIKSDYPKEWLEIELLHDFELEQGHLQLLKQISHVEEVLKVGHRYRFKLAHARAAQELLTAVSQIAEIRRFELMEPTLNEIFIKWVGESHE